MQDGYENAIEVTWENVNITVEVETLTAANPTYSVQQLQDIDGSH